MDKDDHYDAHSHSYQNPRSRSDELGRSAFGPNPVKSLQDDSRGDSKRIKRGSSSSTPLDLNKVVCSFEKPEKEHGSNLKGFEWDLNEEDVSSSLNNCNNFKLTEESECGSTTGSLEGDSVEVLKQIKQNGFLSSSSHGGIPMPKKRGRKSNKIDGLKQKIEIAKKEQVDRFARIAAPSGLLNGLNPGIINHVRNSKQVHSIIEALVRSEKKEQTKTTVKRETNDRKDPEIVDQIAARDSETSGTTVEMVLENNQGSEDDDLTLKLCSSIITKESEKTSSLSNDTDVSNLTVKAADVASQWLDLLRRDINGRLSALQQSRKRVRDVIRTELPLMLSREFSSNQEIKAFFMKNSVKANAHRSRWHVLFDQMEQTLCEEERQLENRLNQVTEMHLHCDKSNRLTSVEKELALRAAAASIYSTCNFLQSKTSSTDN
ncbi:uncharacterized protein LOC124932524 [Impatiens glandulifera]|uniref:uncharacterized protein LOC124932524 n=1 Tax=Impatiens glandulifera TaxID=253017 RepID=UPI001FB06697|nr:uncharacterized protein LOC124932524 [Impatiens glandulifera]